MVFSAKVVEERSSGKLMLQIGMVGFVFIIVSLIVPTLQSIAPFFVVALLAVIIGIAIYNRGDVSTYKMVNDLLVYADGMQICSIVFPYSEISKLHFEFQSYYHAMDYRVAKTHEQQSFGIGNNLSFVYRNQTFRYQFYLHSRQHYVQFVEMLEQLYCHRISFVEKNLKGQTFLMRNVNAEQLQSLKKQYQYD